MARGADPLHPRRGGEPAPPVNAARGPLARPVVLARLRILVAPAREEALHAGRDFTRLAIGPRAMHDDLRREADVLPHRVDQAPADARPHDLPRVSNPDAVMRCDRSAGR